MCLCFLFANHPPLPACLEVAKSAYLLRSCVSQYLLLFILVSDNVQHDLQHWSLITFPKWKEENLGNKRKTPCTTSTSLMCQLSACLLLFAVFAPSFSLRSTYCVAVSSAYYLTHYCCHAFSPSLSFSPLDLIRFLVWSETICFILFFFSFYKIKKYVSCEFDWLNSIVDTQLCKLRNTFRLYYAPFFSPNFTNCMIGRSRVF